MSYVINVENHAANSKALVIKGIKTGEIRYEDLPPAVVVRVGWDVLDGGTIWREVSWAYIPPNRIAWLKALMDECPDGCTPVISTRSLENEGISFKEIGMVAKSLGHKDVRLVF